MPELSAPLAPEPLEGWYALHQIFETDRAAGVPFESLRAELAADVRSTFGDPVSATASGWTAAVELIGSTADLVLGHFRPTLADIREVQRLLVAIGRRRAPGH